MRNKTIACVVSCCVCFGLFSSFVVADYGGGDGTSDFPFLIFKPAHLIAIGENPHHWDKHFILMDNINLEGATITPIAPTEDPQGWPFVGTIFSGVFDGNNKVISNFEIDQPNSNFTGFFGYIGGGGQVKDLGLVNIKISGRDSTGGLAGSIGDWGVFGTTISNCYVLGEIIGNNGVGGLCGAHNHATIESSYTEGAISGNEGVGGLCGYLNYGTLNKSYAAGTVSGHANVGGLVGQNYFGEVLSCFATCEVTGHTYVGGLCGHNHFNTISNSYATGAVSGTEHVGGLLGRNYWGKVVCCYSTGKTTGIWNVGGLVGSAESGEGYEDTANRWDIDTSEVSDSAMGLGRTTEDMQTRLTHTYPFFTWDFDEFWCMPYRGYPLLRWQTGYSGPSYAYMIFEPTQLLALGGDPDHWNEYLILTADIDMAGHDWTADNFIGKDFLSPFSGTFDGSGHCIKNLTFHISSGSMVGLFRYVYWGTIRNLGLVNTAIAMDTATTVGPLVGSLNYGVVDNCHASYAIAILNKAQNVGGLVGSVSFSDILNSRSRGVLTVGAESTYIGGLAGFATSLGNTISNCSSAGEIITGPSSQQIGGLVGRQYISIENSHSTCSINTGASNLVGGLVGYQTGGTIDGCFSMGSVSGRTSIGGLVGSVRIEGSASGAIRNSSSTSPVYIGSQQGGGLVGTAVSVWIENCHSSGAVTAADSTNSIGGLVGALWPGESFSTLRDSYSTGSVSGGVNASGVGGLVGNSASSAVRRCYSSGPVTVEGGPFGVGGLIGSQGSGAVTENSYSLSSVAGGVNGRVGGLIGVVSGSVTHSFSAGPVLSHGTSHGGLIGEAQLAAFTASFWDTEASGQTTSAGGTNVKGFPTSVMQTQGTFTSVGWDFDDVWMMFDYPGFQWQSEIGVSGEFSARVSAGEEAFIEFYVFGLRDAAIEWTLQGYETCDWITDVSTVSGSSTGPTDATLVRLTLDSTGVELGYHAHELILSANDKTLSKPILLNVFERVDLKDFLLLAFHWGTEGCNFGQPCKAVDWYVDGVIDMKDLLQLAASWLDEEIIKERATVEEGFESGDFSNLPWQHSGDADWVIVDSGAYEGAYAARSGAIGDLQTSTLEVTLDLTGWEVNTIGFAVKTSSEANWDVLRFYIDGVERGLGWSGVMNDYGYLTFGITPGLRTLKWTYSKDAGGSVGEDCAWIDDIRIYAQ